MKLLIEKHHKFDQENQEIKMPKDRKIGIAMDFSESSKNALRWAIDNLADKGDTFYIIHALPTSEAGRNSLWLKSGSRKSSL